MGRCICFGFWRKKYKLNDGKVVKQEPKKVDKKVDIVKPDKPPAPVVLPPVVEPYNNHTLEKIVEDPSPSTSTASSSHTSSEKVQDKKHVGFDIDDSQNVVKDDPIPPDPNTSDDEHFEHRREGVRAERISIDDDLHLVKHEKSKEDEDVIKSAILKNEFLRNVLEDNNLPDIIGCMYKRTVEADEVIITQGEKGMHIFISHTGTYEIIIANKLESSFTDQRVFGELSILYNAKRLATIKAATSGDLWVLDHQDYLKIVTYNAQKEQEEYFSFLKNVSLLKDAGESNLRRTANLLKKEFFKPDSVIIREGDRGDKFYIIRAGNVTVNTIKDGDVTTLTKGQFFGEKALLKEDFRQATCTALAPGVECLTLDRTEFIEYLGGLDTWPKDEPSTKPDDVTNVELDEKNYIDPKYAEIELNNLTRITTLGVGGFGRVDLVVHSKDKSVYALKYLKKSEVVQQHQTEHVFNEKRIQMSCNTAFIVCLYKTFKDDKYLYFLMECCMGGDLWTLLKNQKHRCFDESDTRFLSAGVLEALSFLHERDYVYRDLKPENLLIDARGYVKLTDFGFAKKLPLGKKTYTFAGTPEYVAPEIVLHRGHDRAVDYWAFGILIYELLVGKTPFQTKDVTHMKTYNLIIKGIDNVDFPTKVPKFAQQLIKKLCRPKPTDRLGCQKNGAADIRNSKFYQGFDWEKFRERKMNSKFVPKLKGATDTRYFDDFPQDNSIPPEIKAAWDVDF